MESNRFDTWAKACAARASRRTALRRGGLGVALVAVVGLDRAQVAAHSPATPAVILRATLAGTFQAKIYHGPDQGLTLTGRLDLTGDSTGRLTGQLVPTKGAVIPVTGQLTGFAINLVFYLPHDQAIIGVGSLGQDPTTQRWVAGGALVGPKGGDRGDWDYCLRCHQFDNEVVCTQINCPGSAQA